MIREDFRISKELGFPVAFCIRQILDENGKVIGYENCSISAEEYEDFEEEDE